DPRAWVERRRRASRLEPGRGGGACPGSVCGGQLFDEIDHRVVELDLVSADDDRAEMALRRKPGIPVAELLVQSPSRNVVVGEAEADPIVTALGSEVLGCTGELGRDPLAAPFRQDEEILDLGDAHLCPGPG